ncbi:MAG: PD-(D/E)XK nuclease family protein [Nakamurella sp.]
MRREWRHFDLLLESGDTQQALLLENKVGAIPTTDQLVRYWDHVEGSRELRHFGRVTPVLLTPMLTHLDVPSPWQAKTYRDLLPGLEQTVEQLAGGDRGTADGYVQMLRVLLEVLQIFDPTGSPDQPVRLPPAVAAAITDNRLGSLIEKHRFAGWRSASPPTWNRWAARCHR